MHYSCILIFIAVTHTLRADATFEDKEQYHEKVNNVFAYRMQYYSCIQQVLCCSDFMSLDTEWKDQMPIYPICSQQFVFFALFIYLHLYTAHLDEIYTLYWEASYPGLISTLVVKKLLGKLLSLHTNSLLQQLFNFSRYAPSSPIGNQTLSYPTFLACYQFKINQTKRINLKF